MKVVTFGEIMLRLSPPDYYRIFNTSTFNVTYGGAEANVAAFLAQVGEESYFVTKLPNNELGKAALGTLRKYGVRTDYVKFGGERIGIYFLEIGASQRPSKVIYDRKYSAIALSSRSDFDWKEILQDAHWFHFTGITPALGDELPDILLDALRTAKELRIPVSCDLNYRKKLWSPEKARKIMEKLMEHVDVLIGNEEDAEKVFGIGSEGTNLATGELDAEGYKKVAGELATRFNLMAVAITLRESISATMNNWSALLFENGEYYLSRKYRIDYVVDRVGGGDAFAAGLIYGFLHRMSPEEKVNFAVAASCLKHTIPGDFNITDVDEIKRLAGGSISGRVER